VRRAAVGGDHQPANEARDYFVVNCLAVDTLLKQTADNIQARVDWCSATLRYEPPRVAIQLGIYLGGLVAIACDGGNVLSDALLKPFRVVFEDTQECADGAYREVACPFLRQVAFAAVEQRLQESLGDLAERWLEQGDALVLEIRVHRTTELGVLRWVDLQRPTRHAGPG